MVDLLPQFLLATIFLFQFGASQLICWRCDPCPNPHDNSSALVAAVNCSSSQTYCAKNTINVLNEPIQISKGCVTSCTSNSFGYSVDCCTTSYCNSSERIRSSLVLLVLILCLINR